MIPELSDIIKNSIYECLENQVAVSYSGGVDSSLIAWIAKQKADVDLFTTGMENSKDILSARIASKLLGLSYHELLVDEPTIVSAYEDVYKLLRLDFLKTEILVPLYIAAKEAKRQGEKVILYGSGAEELFVGYNRYYTYYREEKDLDKILREEFRTLKDREIKWVKKICYKLGLEARFPYYNKKIAGIMFQIPLEERMADETRKKGIIRDVAKFLNLPESITNRKKTAAQYGSGVHKILARYAKMHGLPGSKYK